MSLLTILLIVVLIFLVLGGGYVGWNGRPGVGPRYAPYYGYPGYYFGGGVIWIILLILLLLLLTGQI